jgi:DNA-binding transcriptional ArsR family regulator
LRSSLINYVAPTDELSPVFAALADPTRRAMLARLAEGEATVSELAAPHALSLPAISRHLKVLERAGLVDKGRDAQWRPCRLNGAPLRRVADWMATYRDFFADRFDRLDVHLQSLVETTTADSPSPDKETTR